MQVVCGHIQPMFDEYHILEISLIPISQTNLMRNYYTLVGFGRLKISRTRFNPALQTLAVIVASITTSSTPVTGAISSPCCQMTSYSSKSISTVSFMLNLFLPP